MNKLLIAFASLVSTTVLYLVSAPLAHAQVCAVCTVAIAGGLGISRLLGVDDALTGVWLGAAIISLASFLGTTVAKKWPHIKYGRIVVMTAIISISLIAIYFADGFIKIDQWDMNQELTKITAVNPRFDPGTLEIPVYEFREFCQGLAGSWRCFNMKFQDGLVHLTHLTWGMIIGVIMLLLGLYLDKAMRRLKNDGGKPYFPFQKVVVPLAMITIGTLAAWIGFVM